MFGERAALLGKTACAFGLGANCCLGMGLGFGLAPHEVAGGGAGELLLAFGSPCCMPKVSTGSQADPMSVPKFNSMAIDLQNHDDLGLV